jgi:hypothetical protein
VVRIERAGTAVMLKLILPEAPPPGAGLNTVTALVPAVARSLGVIAAVNVVLLTYVVVRAAPPHRTTELEMNFDPVTVTVSSWLPAGALEGVIEVATGTGFCVVDDEEEEDVPPPQLVSTNANIPMQPIARILRNRF